MDVQNAIEQEDGSVKVTLANGSVCFVPPVEGNHEYEQLGQLVERGPFRIEGARRCGLRPEDVAARGERRRQEAREDAERALALAKVIAEREAAEQAATATREQERIERLVAAEVSRREDARRRAIRRF
jgi:hypothetical protein